MQQDREIADFLRDLVRDDRQRGDDAEMGIGQERRRDDDAVHEIVEGIADHDHHAAAPMRILLMRLAMFVVAMPPQQQFFQREEQQDAEQHRAAHRRRVAAPLYRLRQDFQEHRAQQCADGIADQRVHPMRAGVQREQRSAQHAQHAAGEAGCDDPKQDRHGDHSGIGISGADYTKGGRTAPG